jgi:hypothetical protein
MLLFSTCFAPSSQCITRAEQVKVVEVGETGTFADAIWSFIATKRLSLTIFLLFT